MVGQYLLLYPVFLQILHNCDGPGGVLEDELGPLKTQTQLSHLFLCIQTALLAYP